MHGRRRYAYSMRELISAVLPTIGGLDSWKCPPRHACMAHIGRGRAHAQTAAVYEQLHVE